MANTPRKGGLCLLRLIFQGLLDLVWPPRTQCLLCDGPLEGEPGSGTLACGACVASMAFEPDTARCANCSRPSHSPCGLCPDCEDGSPFGVVFALGPHKGALREAIHHFKFGDRPELAALLGPRLAAAISVGHDCIVPVPLHRSRLRERGYNQAALLARSISQVKGCPVYEQALVRLRSTGHQAKLDRQSRLRNLQGAFSAPQGTPPPWQGKRVLLVDDVLTTGTTAAASAEILYQTGARSVDVAVAAVSTTPVRRKLQTSH
jgi:ComF family protein